MRFPFQICVYALLLFCIPEECGSQSDIDYGIGVVIFPGGDNSYGVVYSKAIVASDTVAMLWGWDCLFHGDTGKVRVSLVGFRKYDYWGLPILFINRDSSWARVVVVSSDGSLRRQGWVNLRTPNTSFRIWADFLARETMVLRPDKSLRFYSKPDKNSLLKIRLFRFPSPFDAYSYILKPIRREGRWLLVDLQTPFLPCGDEDAIVKDNSIRARTIRVWIQYLDERGRPLVRAPMMC